MTATFPLLAAAIRAIDGANADDPNTEFAGGERLPKELLYGRRMSAWLERLEPQAPEALRLAVRARHIRRWEIPRSKYPMGRKGHHMWRTALMRFHAETVGAILAEVGYDDAIIARVQALVRKEKPRSDLEAQALEDAACLVFLENHFAAFAKKHDEAKLANILRKTWKKMSPAAREAALALELGAEERALVERALAG